MPPRGFDRMRFSQLMQGLRGGGSPARFRGGNPDLEARNALLQQRRGSIGRLRGGSPAASGMYTVRDMENHPGVIWSRQQAQGPAQSAIDEITGSVYADLGEKGIYRDDSGTWHIDMAKNRAYRDAQNALTAPSGPASPAVPAITSPGRPSVPGSTGSAIGSVRTLPTPPAGPQPGGSLGMPPTGGQPGAIGSVRTLPPGPASQSITQPLPATTPMPQASGQQINANGVPQRGVQGNTVSGPPTAASPTIGPVRTLPPGQATQQSITQPYPPQAVPSQSSLPNQRGISGNTVSGPAPSPGPSYPGGVNPAMVPGSGVYGQGQVTPGLGGYPTMPAGQAPQQTPAAMPPTTGPTQNQPRDLSNLGNEIEMNVRNRLAQAGIGGPRRNPLEGMPGQPGGQPTLGQTIRDRVFGQLGMNQPPGIPGRPVVPGRPGMPNMPQPPQRPGTVVPQPPQQPGISTTPGGTPQPPQQPGITPAPGGTTPAPTGPTGNGTLGSPGGNYAEVDKYNAQFESAAAEFGVPADVLKAMAMIESGGAGMNAGCRDDGFGDGLSCGMMQVKGDIWNGTAGCYDQTDASCNIRTAAAILKQGMDQCGGDWRCAITSIYFPTGDPNGTSQADYLAAMDQHLAAINGAAPSTQQTGMTPGAGGPVPVPPGGVPVPPGGVPAPSGGVPAPPGGVPVPPSSASIQGTAPNGQPMSAIDQQSTAWADGLLPGAGAATAQNGYGFGTDLGINLYGNYGPDWACSTCHTGVDVPTNGSQQFNSLVSGTVVCYGEAGDDGSDKQHSCGAYGDVGGGIGNLTIETADHAIVTYGHVRQGFVGLGGEVSSGQALGMSGDNGGYHVHVEVRLPVGPGGAYQMVDPNLYFSGYYCQYGFCPQ